MSPTKPEVRAGVQDEELSGAQVLVTGATDGIGRETALALGRLGADLRIHGRSAEKAKALVKELRDTPGTAEYHLGDFLNESAVQDLADAVLEEWDELDVLVNNAGTHFGTGKLTDAGVEQTIAVNHLAPFVLTNRLAPSLKRTGGRVVTVASRVHRRADFDLESMTSVSGYSGFDAYSRSKFANVLFTKALARRLDSASANCLHPGFVPGTGLWRSAGLGLRLVMGVVGALPGPIQNMVGKTSAKAARTPVYLSASPEVSEVNGGYFSDMELTEPDARTTDVDLQERLWERSAELVSMDRSYLLAESRGDTTED